jgi:hypothetical protein
MLIRILWACLKSFLLITFWRYIYIFFLKVKKKSQNSWNQGFSYYFCLLTEGSGAWSGSIPLTNESGSRFSWPKKYGMEPTDSHPDPEHWFGYLFPCVKVRVRGRRSACARCAAPWEWRAGIHAALCSGPSTRLSHSGKQLTGPLPLSLSQHMLFFYLQKSSRYNFSGLWIRFDLMRIRIHHFS